MEGEKFSDPPIFHVYTKELNRLQPSDRSVVGVLYACVKAVVGTAPAPAVPESGDEYPEVPSNDEYCDPSGSFVRLSDISSRDTLKALTHSVDILAKVVSLSPYTLEMNDSVRRQRLKKLLLPQTAIPSSSRAPYREDMTNFEISARIRLQFHRLLSENGLPLRPLMSQVEQGIKESELLTFSSLAPSDLYRSNQLQEFADMVLKETKALPNFTGALQMGDGEDGSMTRRKYFRFCSALLLAQILSDEHVTEPLVLKRYYPMTDDLLYCLHWPPPDRRNKKDIWKFTLRQLVSRATSKKQSKRSKKVEPVEGDTELVTETTDVSTETVTLTPAGKMILMVKKHGTDAANPYMTAFLHGTTFGVRMVPLDEHRSVDDDEEVDDSEPSSAAVAAATAAAPTAAAPTAPVAPVAGTEESTGDQNASSTELNATSLNLLKCGFFYHTTDDVRYHVFDGPSHDPVVKPDKFGTVCVSARFPQRLQVTACSNGSIQVLSDASVMKEDKVSPTEAEYPLFYEKSRLVGEKGTVYRRFDGKTHPIVAEYLFSDGSRELHLSTDLLQRYRNRSPRTAVAQSTMDDIFEFSLLKLVPLETKIIRLGANGDVVCFCVQQEAAAAGPSSTEDPHVSAAPSTTDLNLEKAIHPAPSSSSSGSHSLKYERLRVNISNIMTTTIDAETKSRVYYYRDGRLLVVYPDESTRVQFPDRTVIHFHPKNKMVYISRFRAWPTIEIDVEVDSMCRGHAQGLEVPINKGGERVRSRVSLPDGSILLVKYDTRVTASSNGSIRLVCRDRTQLLVQDNGQLCFRPFTTWNKDAQQSFDKDLMIEDVVPEVVSHTGLTMAHFTPLADMDHPLLQDTSLNGGSSTTTLPTETSSKVKEDASRVSYQGKQTAAALKAKQRRQDSMNTIKTVPSGATLPPSTAGAGGATKGVATKHLKNEKTSVPDATAKAPEDMDHHELFTSSAEADAVVTVHLRESRLHVLDYEFNAFDVDLTPGRRALLLQRQQEAAMTPAEKKRASSARAQRDDSNTSSNNDESSDPASFTYTVRLAGEVEGLKPPAVARIPKSPRCFVINRFGDATEVLSLQDVSVWECYFKNIGDAYRVEASVTLPPAELGPCRVLRYFVPKRLVSSYLDGFRFDEIVGKRQYCSAVIPAAAQYYLEHQSATLHHVNEEEWLVHHLPRIFEALSLTERHPLSNEGYNRITQAIQRCEEFRQERIKNIDRFAIEDPRTPEQIEEEEMMVKRLKQLYKAAKAVAGKKKEHRSDPMKIEEGDEGEEDEESVADKRKGPGSLASSPSKVNSARSRGTGSNAGAGVMKGKQHTILEAQNEDEDAEEGDEDEPDFGSEDEKEPDPVEVLIKNTFEDFLSDAYPNGGYNSELLPVSYLQDAFIQMFNRFISPELIEQASYDCGEVDPGLEELTMNEFRAVYFSLDRIINGRTDPHADRNNAGYDNDFTHSQDSYDEDEFDESASRHRSRPTTTTSNNPTYEDEGVSRSRAGRNTASAPPLNFNKLHQDGTPQSSVLGDGSKDPTKWDDGGSLGMGSTAYSEASPRAGTFAAGSGLRMVRNVKSANP